jgi:hypothetical protein
MTTGGERHDCGPRCGAQGAHHPLRRMWREQHTGAPAAAASGRARLSLYVNAAFTHRPLRLSSVAPGKRRVVRHVPAAFHAPHPKSCARVARACLPGRLACVPAAACHDARGARQLRGPERRRADAGHAAPVGRAGRAGHAPSHGGARAVAAQAARAGVGDGRGVAGGLHARLHAVRQHAARAALRVRARAAAQLGRQQAGRGPVAVGGSGGGGAGGGQGQHGRERERCAARGGAAAPRCAGPAGAAPFLFVVRTLPRVGPRRSSTPNARAGALARRSVPATPRPRARAWQPGRPPAWPLF